MSIPFLSECMLNWFHNWILLIENTGSEFLAIEIFAFFYSDYYIVLFFSGLRAGGILQILQSDWFRERAVFLWSLFFVNKQKKLFLNHFVFNNLRCY